MLYICRYVKQPMPCVMDLPIDHVPMIMELLGEIVELENRPAK